MAHSASPDKCRSIRIFAQQRGEFEIALILPCSSSFQKESFEPDSRQADQHEDSSWWNRKSPLPIGPVWWSESKEACRLNSLCVSGLPKKQVCGSENMSRRCRVRFHRRSTGLVSYMTLAPVSEPLLSERKTLESPEAVFIGYFLADEFSIALLLEQEKKAHNHPDTVSQVPFFLDKVYEFVAPDDPAFFRQGNVFAQSQEHAGSEVQSVREECQSELSAKAQNGRQS